MSGMPTIGRVVLTGPHGAGKTTIGRLLAARLGWPFSAEIGRELRDRALARNPGRHALVRQESFDQEVIARELERDRAERGPRVVETWHPGNLAYAAERSPRAYRSGIRAVSTALPGLRGLTVVQPLSIEPVTARARLSEPGPDPYALTTFFLAVAGRAGEISRLLRLPLLPPVRTDDLPPEVAARVIEMRVRDLLDGRAASTDYFFDAAPATAARGRAEQRPA